MKQFKIFNITDDSFSGDGVFQDSIDLTQRLKAIKTDNVVFDIGAQSTRPNAKTLTWNEEIKRLESDQASKIIKFAKSNNTALSIDSFYTEVWEWAIDNGFTYINDVSGHINDESISIVKNNDVKIVFMHSLSVPASREVIFKCNNEDMLEEIIFYARRYKDIMHKNNISEEKLIFDIGLGFGKNASQSLYLLQNLDYIKEQVQLPMFVGHSRKSFLRAREFVKIAMEHDKTLDLNANNVDENGLLNISDIKILDKLTQIASDLYLTDFNCDFVRLH